MSIMILVTIIGITTGLPAVASSYYDCVNLVSATKVGKLVEGSGDIWGSTQALDAITLCQ